MKKYFILQLLVLILAGNLYAQVNLGGAVTVGGSAGSGTGTVTHATGPLTTGQPTRATGIADIITSPRFQDAHKNDNLGDMSQAIKATWSDCVASAGPGGASSCAVKAGYPGYQFWSVNPLATGINGGDLDLCSAGVTDIRVGNGVSPISVIIPEGMHLHGCGNSSLNEAPGSNYHNTIIRACNPLFMTGAGTYGAAPCQAFYVNNKPVTDSNYAGTTVTVTADNQLAIGQDVFIYDGTDANALTGHFMVATRSATQFTITVAAGLPLGHCAANCGTMYEGTPLIRQQNTASFISELNGLTLDCGWVRGCIPYVNATGEEQTRVHDLNIVNYGGEGIRVSAYRFATFAFGAYGGNNNSSFLGAINSGGYTDLHIHFTSETCELLAGCPSAAGTNPTGTAANATFDGTSALVQVVNCSTFDILADGNKNQSVRGFENFTLDPSVSTALAPQLRSTGWTNASSCAAGNGPGLGSAFGILAFGMTTQFSNFHIEFMPTGIVTGGSTALNAYWPGGTASNIKFENFQLCVSDVAHGGCNGDSNYAIDIGPASSDITFENFNNTSQNTLKDEVTNQVCGSASVATEGPQSFYILGHGTPPLLWTSCLGVINTINNPITQVGLAFASLPVTPAVGTTQFCTNCIPTTAITCNTANPANCVCKAGTGSMTAKYENFMNNGNNWYCH